MEWWSWSEPHWISPADLISGREKWDIGRSCWVLSQLSRLIGLEGRPQANWICRGLINSGKVLPPTPFTAEPYMPNTQLYPPLLPLNPPVFWTPYATLGGHTGVGGGAFACLCVRQTLAGHPQILIKYHLTCPTSKSHRTWSDQAGIRLAGGKRALVVNCHFGIRHSFFFFTIFNLRLKHPYLIRPHWYVMWGFKEDSKSQIHVFKMG